MGSCSSDKHALNMFRRYVSAEDGRCWSISLEIIRGPVALCLGASLIVELSSSKVISWVSGWYMLGLIFVIGV